MRLSISEARQKLPSLVKLVRKDPNTVVQISHRAEIVAELRAAARGPKAGSAPRRLMELRRKLARRGDRTDDPNVSARVKDHLYGARGVVR